MICPDPYNAACSWFREKPTEGLEPPHCKFAGYVEGTGWTCHSARMLSIYEMLKSLLNVEPMVSPPGTEMENIHER